MEKGTILPTVVEIIGNIFNTLTYQVYNGQNTQFHQKIRIHLEIEIWLEAYTNCLLEK